MIAPPAPLWRKLLACLPRLTRRAPFVRIPLFEIVERQRRNAILKAPVEALLECSTMAELSEVAHVLRQRGIDWRQVIGLRRAVELSGKLAWEMRDDGGPR